MKILFVCLAIGLSLAPLTSAQATTPKAVQEAAEALYLWEPVAIAQQGSRLVITSKERRVSQTVYTAMIRAGICLFARTGDIQLMGIKEILILNKFRGSGWVFEGGKSACVSLAQAAPDKVDILILGRSHLYSHSIDGAVE